MLQELVLHKDRCQECGTGLPTVYDKVRCLKSFLEPRWAGQTFSFPLPHCPRKKDDAGRAYRECREVKKADVDKHFLTPADEVERRLFPAVATELERLIAQWNTKYHSPRRLIGYETDYVHSRCGHFLDRGAGEMPALWGKG